MVSNRLVSVIMPTYNAGKYLADSISSILDQTYLDLELLITDDGSTDPVTLDILHKIEERDSRVDVLYLDHNHGAGYARNKSIERAKGRYIAFCDSDDRWTLDKLEKQIAFMNQKQCALSCASYIIFNFDEQKTVGINIAPPKITFSSAAALSSSSSFALRTTANSYLFIALPPCGLWPLTSVSRARILMCHG